MTNAESCKKWYYENKEYAAKKNKEYYQKNKEKKRQYAKEWNLTHKEKRILINKKYTYRQLKLWFEALKEIGYTKCSICEYDKCFAAIEFHHPDPLRKEEESAIILHSKFTQDRFNVIKVTLPLCANCHRELHDKDRERYYV